MKEHVILFGAPGSGKGTQSSALQKHFNLKHISTGELLRAEIKKDSAIGRLAKGLIDKGQLVPDEVMLQIIEQLICDRSTQEGGVIFDGFPRTVAQAQALNEILEKHQQKVRCFIELFVPDEELVDRLLKRGLESGRSDDNLETIKKRIALYHSTATPIAEFYQTLGIRSTVQGTGSIEDITQRLLNVIEKVAE
jgi:adenylate kinase